MEQPWRGGGSGGTSFVVGGGAFVVGGALVEVEALVVMGTNVEG